MRQSCDVFSENKGIKKIENFIALIIYSIFLCKFAFLNEY